MFRQNVSSTMAALLFLSCAGVLFFMWSEVPQTSTVMRHEGFLERGSARKLSAVAEPRVNGSPAPTSEDVDVAWTQAAGAFAERFWPHCSVAIFFIALVIVAWRRNIYVSRLISSKGSPDVIKAQRHLEHLRDAKLLHEVFERSANKWPELPCLKISPGGASYTYAEINEMADRAAVRLACLVKTSHAIVGVALQNSCLDAVIAYLAILKVGGTVLPLDCDVSGKYQLNEMTSEIPLVLSSVSDPALLAALNVGTRVVPVSNLLEECDEVSTLSRPLDAAKPMQPALVPLDGEIGIEHKVFARTVVHDSEKLMLIAGVDAVGICTSVAKVEAVQDMFLAWAAGVPVVCFPAGVPSEAALAKEAVTYLRCGPAFFDRADPVQLTVPVLRIVAVQEAAEMELAEKFRTAGRRVVHVEMPGLWVNPVKEVPTNFNSSDGGASTCADSEEADPSSSSSSGPASAREVPSAAVGGEMPPLEHVPHLAGARFLHDIFELSAAQWPQAPCLSVAGTADVKTYKELSDVSSCVAERLAEFVTGPGVVVGVNLSRESWTAFAAALGVLKAGAAALLIDASVPAALKQHMISEAQPVLIIGEPIEGVESPLLNFDAVSAPLPAGASRESRAPWLSEDDAAMVLFTSGSTGKPKGLRNAHRAYVHFHKHNAELLRMPGKDFRVAQQAKLGFDVANREMFMPWCVGACLHVMPPAFVASCTSVADAWHGERIGAVCAVPSLLAVAGKLHPTLRVAYLAGEPVPRSLLKTVLGDGRVVVNGYGTSETPMSAVRAVFAHIDDLSGSEDLVPIGRPVPGMRIVLLDGLRTVPAGETGEVCIGGVQVTLGYMDAAKSAAALIDHPDHGRLYRTGDLGRMREDGSFEVLGRNDDQVKIAGNRLELAGVDVALRDAWGAEAMVKMAATGQLVAYVEDSALSSALEPIPAAQAKELQQKLAVVLPSYGIPARFFAVQKLPRTTVSMKLSRRMLPEPPVAVVEPSDAANEVEAWVLMTALAAFQDSIGLDDPLTTCGGSSLAVTRLLSMLRCGEDAPASVANSRMALTMRTLLGSLTLRELARHLQEAERSFVQAQGLTTSTSADAEASAEKVVDEHVFSHWLFTTLQLLWLFINLVIVGWSFFFAYWLLLHEAGNKGLAGKSTVSFTFCMLVLLVWIVMWMRALKMQPGVYPLYGSTHLKYWCTDRFLDVIVNGFLAMDLPGCVSIVLRWCGAKVGKRVSWTTVARISAPMCLEIGDDVICDAEISLKPVVFEKTCMRVGRITIASGCKLGSGCYVGPDVSLGCDCEVAPLASIMKPVQSPPSTLWEGNPASPSPAAPTEFRNRLREVAKLSESCLFPIVDWAAFVFALVCRVFRIFIAIYLVWHPLLKMIAILRAGHMVTASFLAMFAARIIFANWFKRWFVGVLLVILCRCLPKVRPGAFSRRSLAAAIANTKKFALGEIQIMHASSPFLAYWFAATGAHIDTAIGNLELGRINGVVPDVFAVAACNSAGVGATTTMVDNRHEAVIVRQLALPEGCFIGNLAYIAPNIYRKNLTVGVATYAPLNTYVAGDEPTQPKIVMGNPGVELPVASAAAEKHYEESLYEPTLTGFAVRVFFTEIFRGIGTLPFYVLSGFFIGLALRLYDHIPHEYKLLFVSGIVPAFFLMHVLVHPLLFVLLKWIVVGRAKEGSYLMWHRFVQQNFFMWRVKLWVAPVYSFLAGTLLMGTYLRMLGARVGQGVMIHTMENHTDVDMLEIGDNAVLRHVRFQLHTFEGRVLKLYKTRIGANAVLDSCNVIGGSTIGDGVTMMPNSCALKGETLLSNKVYVGSPAALQF